MSSKIDHWKKMLEIVHKDAEGVLSDHRNIYKTYVEMINNTPKQVRTPFDFHDFVRRQHGTAVAMFIRRQIDTKYMSLYRLLTELEKNAELITFAWYKELCGGSAWASSGFSDFSEDGKVLSSKIVKEDRKVLLTLGEKVGRYATEQIAHRSTSESLKVTYNELDAFLDSYEELLKKYIRLLTGAGYDSIAPTFQYDWIKVFRYPWLESN